MVIIAMEFSAFNLVPFLYLLDTEALAFWNFFFLMFSTYVCAISSRKLFLIDDYSQSHQRMVMDEKLADELLFGASLLGIILQV